MSPERCTTVLLPDEPARKDAFGSHETVASAVADLIRTEDGGRAIALTGTWGSGKSTTIELLKDKLTDTVEVFVFNAWSHQGDPLRRSFLEQLIDFLIDRNLLLERESWLQKKDELSNRKREQETESTPVLKTHAKVIGTLLLLTPFGIAAFSRLAVPNVPNWLPKIGALVALAPFAAFLFVSIVSYFLAAARWLANKRTWQLPRLLSLLIAKWPKPLELFDISVSHSVTKTKSLTFETDDPTSLEFQRCFDLALKSVFAAGKKKLAIIIDNLDRMDPDLALSLWATMGTFFDFRTGADSAWLGSLWLIVPFDPTALSRLFPKSIEKQIASNQVSEAQLEAKHRELSRVFVEKTFATSFHIPPPVLSDWKDFLIARLKEALPGHSNKPEELHSVYRIYSRANLNEKRSPTPRDIKIFINKLGAIHRQHADTISLPLQALYVVIERDSLDVPAILQMEDDQKPLGQIPVELVGADWRGFLAAIYYNTEPDHALQLLLGRRLEKSLLTKDSEDLTKLRNIHGIPQVLEEIVESNASDWAEKETASLAMTAASLGELALPEDDSIQRSWRLLCDAASNVKAWPTINNDIARGMVDLFEHRDSEAFGRSLLTSLAKSKIAEDKGEAAIDATVIRTWLSAITQVLSAIQAKHTPALESFSVQATPLTYLALMADVAQVEKANTIVSFLRPSTPSASIDELSKSVSSGNFDSRYEAAISSMLKVNAPWKWNALIDQMKARLNGTITLEAAEIKVLVSTLLNLASSVSSGKESLDFLAEQGHLSHQLSAVSGANDYDGVSLCVLPILLKVGSGAPTQTIGNSVEGTEIYNQLLAKPAAHEEVLQKLTALVTKFDKTQDILDLAKKKQTKALAESILRLVAKDERSTEQIRAEDLISNFSILKEACDSATLEGLIRKSISEAALVDAVVARDFDPTMAEMYRLLVSVADTNTEFPQFLKRGLASVSESTWLSQLTAEGPLIALTIEMVEKKEQLGLTLALQDALLAHAKRLLTGELKVERLRDKWEHLPDALRPPSQDTLFRTMSDDLLCQYEDGSTDSVLDLYGERLSSESVLSHNTENLVLHAFHNFLSRSSIVELQWLCRAVSLKADLLSSVKPSTREDFENRVVKAFRENKEKEDVRTEIEAIAKATKIELTEEDPSPENPVEEAKSDNSEAA